MMIRVALVLVAVLGCALPASAQYSAERISLSNVADDTISVYLALGDGSCAERSESEFLSLEPGETISRQVSGSICYTWSFSSSPLESPISGGEARSGDAVEVGRIGDWNSPEIELGEEDEKRATGFIATSALELGEQEAAVNFVPLEDSLPLGSFAATDRNTERFVLAEWLDHINRQSKTDCVKWWKGKIPFDGEWKTCGGHRTRWRCMRRRLVLEVSGPTTVNIKGAAEECLKTAAVAGAVSAIVTGGGALAVAERTLYACLAAKIGGDLFSLSIKNEGGWTDWGGC